MFPQLVTTLTLAATLLHSVLGCCWHHDHEAKAEPRSTHSTCCTCHSGQRAETVGSGRESTPLDDESSPASPEPGRHSHECCSEIGCVYVVADEGGSFLNVVEWNTVVLPTPLVQPSASLGERLEFLRDFSLPRLAAQELRAWLQVWTV
ncbi:hypothetical protein Pan44_46030 [Caulifigura coniformis]|uniref:Uncharacterized protein n=1 Tax=Caulifigura coniformis TaxID=2527983 RepID=A0A517SK97_9PLAN|nr:hypothetical protein [Caulifigura coniformis]QDT56547.1 hypothetical protein Pan44_46030 [Caulifigura coniformis]